MQPLEHNSQMQWPNSPFQGCLFSTYFVFILQNLHALISTIFYANEQAFTFPANPPNFYGTAQKQSARNFIVIVYYT